MNKQQQDKLLAEEVSRLEKSSAHAGDIGTWGHLIFEKANEAVKLGQATWGDTKSLYSYLINNYPRLITAAERPDNGKQILAAAHFIHSHKPIEKIIIDYLKRMSAGVEDFFYQKVLQHSGHKSDETINKDTVSSIQYPFLFTFKKEMPKTTKDFIDLGWQARQFADQLGSVFSSQKEVIKKYPEIKGDKSLRSIIRKIETHEKKFLEAAKKQGVFNGNVTDGGVAKYVNQAIGKGLNQYFLELFPFLKGKTIKSLSTNLRASMAVKIMQLLNTPEAGAVIFFLTRDPISSREFLRRSADIKRMAFTQTEKRIGIANTKDKQMYFGSIDALYHDANRWFSQNGDYTVADFKTTRAFHVGHVFQVGIMYPGMLGTVLGKNGKKLHVEPGVDIRVGLLNGQENLDTSFSTGKQLVDVPDALDIKGAQERKRFLKIVSSNFAHLMKTITSGGARIIADFKYVFESGQKISVNTGESNASFMNTNAVKWVQSIEKGGFQIGPYNLSLEDMMKIYEFCSPAQRKQLYWALKNTVTQTYKELYGLYLSPNGSAKIKRIPESETADQWTITENDIIYSLEKTFHMTGADILHSAWDSLLRKGDSGRSQIFGKSGNAIAFRKSTFYKDFAGIMGQSDALQEIYDTYEKNFRLGEMSRRMSSNPNEPSRGGSHYTNDARNEYDRISDELKDSKALQEAWDHYFNIMREFGLFPGNKAIQPFSQHLDFGRMDIESYLARGENKGKIDNIYHVIALIKIALGDKKSGNGVIGDLLGERNGKFKNNKGELSAINYLLEKYFEDEIKNINSYLIGNGRTLSMQNKLFLSELVNALGAGINAQKHYSIQDTTAHRIAHLLSVANVNKYYILRWKQRSGMTDSKGLEYKHLSQITEEDIVDYIEKKSTDSDEGKLNKAEDFRILSKLKTLFAKKYEDYQDIAKKSLMIPLDILSKWAAGNSADRAKIEKDNKSLAESFNSLNELYELAENYGSATGFYQNFFKGEKRQLENFLYYVALRESAQEALGPYLATLTDDYGFSDSDIKELKRSGALSDRDKNSDKDEDDEESSGLSYHKAQRGTLSKVVDELVDVLNLSKDDYNAITFGPELIDTVDKIKSLLHIDASNQTKYMGIAGLSTKEMSMLSNLSPMGEEMNPYLFLDLTLKPGDIVSGRFNGKGIGGSSSFKAVVDTYIKGIELSLNKLGFFSRGGFIDVETSRYKQYLYAFVADLHRIVYFLHSASSQNDYLAMQLKQVIGLLMSSKIPTPFWNSKISTKEIDNIAATTRFWKEGFRGDIIRDDINSVIGSSKFKSDPGAPSNKNYFPYMHGEGEQTGAKTLPEVISALKEWKRKAQGITSKYNKQALLASAYELKYTLSRIKGDTFISYIHRATQALAFLLYHGKSVNFPPVLKVYVGALDEEHNRFMTSAAGRNADSRKKVLQEYLGGFFESYQFLREMYLLLSKDWEYLFHNDKIKDKVFTSFQEIVDLWKQIQQILPEEFGELTENKANQIKLGGINMADNALYRDFLADFKQRGLGIAELAQIIEKAEARNLSPNDEDYAAVVAMMSAAADLMSQYTSEKTRKMGPSNRKQPKLTRAASAFTGSYRGLLSSFTDESNGAIYKSNEEMLNSIFGKMFYKRGDSPAARKTNLQAFVNMYGHFDPNMGLVDEKGNQLSQEEYLNRFVNAGLGVGFTKEGLNASLMKAIDKSKLEDDQKLDAKMKISDAINEAQESQESLQEQVTEELEKQVDLQKEILDLTTKINTAQRKKQVDTAASLGKDRTRKAKEQGESYAKALKKIVKIYRDMGYNEADATRLALYGDHKDGKEINGLRDMYGQAVAENSTRAALERDQTREGDLKHRESLLRQRNALSKSTYDNQLTYQTTYDKAYRIALNDQQEEMSKQLNDIEEELSELSERYKDDKAFNERAAAQNANAEKLLGRGIRDIDVKHKGKDTLWGQLAAQMTGMITRFTQMGAAYKIIGSVKRGFDQVTQSARNLDKALTDLRIVTGKTGNEAKNTMQQFANLASQLGVTTNEVAQSATAWLRQGYDMAQVTDLVTSSMYLSKLGMISVDEATQGLTSTLKGFKIEAREAMDIVDRFTALDVKAATTAGEIANGLAQFANLANMSGVSIDQASAMVATIADVSQVSGTQAGNSLKMMLSRYGTVKSGKFSSMEGEGDTESLNDVEKVLTKIGISMRDTNGQFREFDEVLDSIAEKWDNLDNISQAAVATAIAGTRQREAFLVLMENMDKYKEFTEISRNSEGTANKKYQSYQEQLQASQNRLAAAWEKLAQDADIASFLKVFTDVSTTLVKLLPGILKALTRLIAIWQGYKIPSALGGAFNGMARFIGLPSLGDAKNSFGSNLKNAKQMAGQASGIHKAGAWIRGFTSNRNQKILDNSNDPVFGLRTVNNWLQRIYERINAPKGKNNPANVMDELSNLTEEEFKKKKNMMKFMKVADNESLLRERLKADYGKEGLTYAEMCTDQDARQLAYEITQSKVKGSGGQGTGVSPAVGGPKRSAAAVAIASGVAGIVSGVMTTGATHQSLSTNQTVESSAGASGAMKGISAGINAVGMVGHIWGPVAGMITQTIASVVDNFFTPWIGSIIDAERDARNARIEAAQKQLSALETIKSSVATIEKYTDTRGYTFEENEEIRQTLKEVKKVIQENSEVFNELIELTGYSKEEVYNYLNNWNKHNKEEHEKFLQAFEAATEEALGVKEIAAQEEKLRKVGSNILANRTLYSRVSDQYGRRRETIGHAVDLDVLQQYATEMGESSGFVYRRSSDFDNPINIIESDKQGTIKEYGTKAFFTGTTVEELIPQYQAFVEWLEKEMASIEDVGQRARYSSTLSKYQKMLKEYEDELAETKEIYHDANEHLISSALLSSSVRNSNGESINLLSANQEQLKQIGKEGIFNAIAERLQETTGLYGYNVNSSEARSLIEEIIKSNEKLYSVWTGQVYTLNEAVSSGNTEVLKSFATALGVSVERLTELQEKFGTLKLADILGTPAETREKASELTSLFTSMASSSGLTAEHLEQIVQKFPEMVKYLKDSVSLGGALLQQIGAYNALYSHQLLSELVESSSYFEEFKNELKTINPAIFDELVNNNATGFGNAKSMQQILSLITSPKEQAMSTYGISENAYNTLQQLYGEYFNFTTKSSLGTEAFDAYVSYWNKIWDRQVSNLEEQKTALQEINKQREYENKLIEAKLRLENASKEKKRVYREGVGWVYEADQNAIKEAQENLETVEREQTISELEQQITEINYMKELLNQIAENQELKNLEDLWKAFVGDSHIADLITSNASIVQQLKTNFESITKLLIDGNTLLSDFTGQKQSAFNSVFGPGKDSLWGKVTIASGEMRDAEELYGRGSSQYRDAEEAYNKALGEYQTGVKGYRDTYGAAGVEDYENNVRDDQKIYAENDMSSHNATTDYFIKENENAVAKRYRLGQHVDANTMSGWQSAYDNAKSQGKDFHIDEWKPGTTGFDETTNTINLSSTPKTVTKDTIKSKYGNSLEETLIGESTGVSSPGMFVKMYANGKDVGQGIAMNNGASGNGVYLLDAARRGSLGLHGGPTLINENGTEAIITPSGTLTALPAKTGVVPADVTRSVWQLGELAPTILRALGIAGGSSIMPGSVPINNSESLNIGTVNMTVSADESFDAEAFVRSLKQQAALSKNNRR